MSDSLQSAITKTLAQHLADLRPGIGGTLGFLCACYRAGQPGEQWWFRSIEGHRAHVADRVLAVLADRLPHTPADQLATLIGGTVRADTDRFDNPIQYVEGPERPLPMTVPDSPPAAPGAAFEPPADPENRRDSRTHPCGCQTYFDLERWRSRTTTACSEHIDDVRSTQPTQYVLPAAPDPRQDT